MGRETFFSQSVKWEVQLYLTTVSSGSNLFFFHSETQMGLFGSPGLALPWQGARAVQAVGVLLVL